MMAGGDRRDYEMAIAQRREKFRIIVPSHVKDKDGFLDKLGFDCSMLVHNNNKLAQCDPASVLMGAMEAARHKLSFAQQECSLIPFGKQATFVLGVRGIIRLLYRTGKFAKIKYGTVMDNDEFDFCEGTGDNDFIRHKKALKDRGDVLAAWASAETVDGVCHIYVMDHDELMKIRNASPGFRAGDTSGAHVKWAEEMHAKAPLKRLWKRLQMDPEHGRNTSEVIDAVAADMTTRSDPEEPAQFFDEDGVVLEEPSGAKDAA